MQYSERYVGCVLCLSPLIRSCGHPLLFVYFHVKNGFWYILDHIQDSSGVMSLLVESSHMRIDSESIHWSIGKASGFIRK